MAAMIHLFAHLLQGAESDLNPTTVLGLLSLARVREASEFDCMPFGSFLFPSIVFMLYSKGYTAYLTFRRCVLFVRKNIYCATLRYRASGYKVYFLVLV